MMSEDFVRKQRKMFEFEGISSIIRGRKVFGIVHQFRDAEETVYILSLIHILIFSSYTYNIINNKLIPL